MCALTLSPSNVPRARAGDLARRSAPPRVLVRAERPRRREARISSTHQIGAWQTSVGVKHERFQVSRIHRDRPREGAATPFTSPSSSLLETTETDVMMMAKHGRRVVSREDGKAAGASAHAARVPGSHTPETRTSFAAVKRARDADHHARSRLRATMSSSPDHAHSMSVRRGPASCGRRAHGHGGTTCRRECSRAAFFVRVIRFFSWTGWEQSRALSQVCSRRRAFLAFEKLSHGASRANLEEPEQREVDFSLS